ncbi:uncharacterized protein LOC107274259 isoform X2 [Cephus cinctus]|uniref:Uncharacterized protein LOC107274259 isoform X2 n=1 Tax=Cephus cinctus TaxID=211228 RepID=A0AAJ7CEA1_CEPCN|nr:uncharacterized protein LOC107274259 isoform X2 [Cephus cinctus]
MATAGLLESVPVAVHGGNECCRPKGVNVFGIAISFTTLRIAIRWYRARRKDILVRTAGPSNTEIWRFRRIRAPPSRESTFTESFARSQFPRSTDRQLEAGALGHEKRNDTLSSAPWKNDDVASKSSMKPFSESERRPAFPISQVNNINERTTGWKGNGKSDHQIVGGSLLDPLGLIEKTENAIENFGEHLSPTFNPIGVIGGKNSHSNLPAPPAPYLWREADNSQIQQTQNAPQNVPLGSPGNPKSQTKQSPLLGSRANSTDSQASTLHQESYRPTSYQSVLRESSPSNPVGSPARLDGDLGGEKQRHRVDSSAWPYRQRTLENPTTYQDGSAWKNGQAARGSDSAGDRASAYRGNPVTGQSSTSYPSNPIGRTHPTAVRYFQPDAGAASPFYGNPSYGYNKNANAQAVSPSRTGQNRQLGGTQQRTTAVNYPAESSYGPNNAEMAASRRENIPAQYTSASQGRTTPLFQDYEYSRPFYGYGNSFLPGRLDRFGSTLSPPFSPQAWLPRPYNFYNDHVFDDIADFSYRSYRPTF